MSSGLSDIIQVMKEVAGQKQGRGIEFATVVSPPPSLRIKVDNMPITLDMSDLIVFESLLEHEIEYSTLPAITATTEVADNHTHQMKSMSITKQKMTIHTRLKAGDKVAVMELNGGQTYVVLDKVVV